MIFAVGTVDAAYFTDLGVRRRVPGAARRGLGRELEQVHHQLHWVVQALRNVVHKSTIDEEADAVGVPARRVGVPVGGVEVDRQPHHVVAQPRVAVGLDPEAERGPGRPDRVAEELHHADLATLVRAVGLEPDKPQATSSSVGDGRVSASPAPPSARTAAVRAAGCAQPVRPVPVLAARRPQRPGPAAGLQVRRAELAVLGRQAGWSASTRSRSVSPCRSNRAADRSGVDQCGR